MNGAGVLVAERRDQGEPPSIAIDVGDVKFDYFDYEEH